MGVFCHLKTGNSWVISFMYKCPIVLIRCSFLFIKDSSQRVKTVSVPSLSVAYIHSLGSCPSWSAWRQLSSHPLPDPDSLL